MALELAQSSTYQHHSDRCYRCVNMAKQNPSASNISGSKICTQEITRKTPVSFWATDTSLLQRPEELSDPNCSFMSIKGLQQLSNNPTTLFLQYTIVNVEFHTSETYHTVFLSMVVA